MGYYSRLQGEITIDPPLTWSEVKDSPFLIGRSSLRLQIEEQRTETHDGEQHVARWVVAIEDRYAGEGVKHYAVADELASIAQTWPDRTYSGHLVRVGEGTGDVERYRIERGRVISEQAALVWPDGTSAVTE